MNLSLLLVPALIGSLSLDDSSDAAFQRGVRERSNAAEARPAFAQAAEGYREKWQLRHQRGTALAWGRAAYLAGDTPTAIAAFRAGLEYYPGDAELLAGLRHCRAEVTSMGVSSIPPEGIRQRLTVRQRWVWAFVAVSFASFGLWCRFTVRWRIGTAAGMLGILGLLGFGVWEWVCEREREENRRFPPMVVLGECALRTGNGETYPPRLPALLPAGTEVRQIGQRGGWIQMELPTGELGWLPERELIKVE